MGPIEWSLYNEMGGAGAVNLEWQPFCPLLKVKLLVGYM